MLVTVRHLTREDYREASCLYDDEELLEFVKGVVRNNNAITVADMEILNNSENGMLSEAFENTNSITGPWYLNNNVTPSDIARGGCRSTSAGDIIQIRGVMFMVARFGFKKLEENKC